jgi:ZIP family zinc transporter
VLIAVLFGLAASSALVIGAAVGARWSPPKQLTGVLLAFASGALISALAFELFALVGAVSMREAGQSARSVMLTWAACAIVLAAAVVLGRGVAGVLSEHVLAVALAFAGGAVLASLADTLMPEAFEHGRPLNAFATAAGFFLSFVLAA